MNLRSRFFFLLVLCFFASCVPNKKFVYLQKNDVNKKNLAADSAVRAYDLRIKDYKIQPLDILSIRIESLTEDSYDFIAKLYPNTQQTGGAGGGNNLLINGFQVTNEGVIEFPVAGKLKFAGLSIFEAQEMMATALRPFLKDPIARIKLLNFRFTVLGEVNLEQQVTSINTRVTLLEAIGLSGGLTDLADRSNVKLIRQNGAKAEIYYVDLLKEGTLESDLYYVQQNDIIVVPSLRQRPFRKYLAPNVALIVSTLSLVVLAITTVTLYNNNNAQ